MVSISVSQDENKSEGEKVLETTDPRSCRRRAIGMEVHFTVRLKDIIGLGA